MLSCGKYRKLQSRQSFFGSVLFSLLSLSRFVSTTNAFTFFFCVAQHALPVFCTGLLLNGWLCSLVISINVRCTQLPLCHCSVFGWWSEFCIFNSHAHNAHPFTYILQFKKICIVHILNTQQLRYRTRTSKHNNELPFHFNWIGFCFLLMSVISLSE